MHTYDKLYIDGGWVPSDGAATIDVINASTEEVCATIPEGTAADVDLAVAAAVAAFDGWAATEPKVRADYVARMGAGIGERSADIADAITAEVGMPRKLSELIQAGLPQAVSAGIAGLAADFPWEEQIGNSLVLQEPIGVVAAITPWNYPLHQIVIKVAAALVAGCTIVVKPSEVAPINAFMLAEVIDTLDLPAGVFNLVTGTGPVVGEALAAHPDVDMVSFTGSTRAGKRVAEVAAATVKKVALELGGKSANILMDDLEGDELAKAARAAVGACYLNSGQTCSALTRLLVPRDRHDEVVELVRDEVESTWTVGDPATNAGRLGPVISAAQRERVRSYIDKGVEEGATLVTGGADAPDGLDTGYYVRPTVFAGVDTSMTIAQEEIFGPVLSILPYDDTDDAVRIANDSLYGLSGGVWSTDQERAKAVARRIRTGQLEINGGRYNAMAPFGGFKQSGIGRELGHYGLEEFLQPKSLQL